MKALLLDERFADWPIVSVAYWAMRNKVVIASKNTWYKYARLLGISRKRRKNRPTYHSLRAKAPNEIWHCDITILKTEDDVKHYLYLLVDNFSRKILSWQLSNKVRASIRKESILEALSKISENEMPKLVFDGGPENINQTVLGACREHGVLPKIALKDIPSSNSMVEAHNKIIKKYLRRRSPKNLVELERILAEVVKDFNEIRPHGSLNGLTPSEVYNGKNTALPHFRIEMEAASRARIAQNRSNSCGICPSKEK